MKKITAFVLSLSLLLTGCAEKPQNTGSEYNTAPWNKYILESENGFYSSDFLMYLSYFDKESKKSMLLCTKPECPHDGRETCTATYRKMMISNTVMYGGALYFAAADKEEDKAVLNLYRAALDGSSLDKVANITSVKDASPDSKKVLHDLTRLRINNGTAYLGYNLMNYPDIHFGGFIEKGLAKINLSSGKVTHISRSDDYFELDDKLGFVTDDYLIYKKGTDAKMEYFRVSLKDDSVEKMPFDSRKVEISTTDGKNLVCVRTPGEGETGKFIYYMNPENYEMVGKEINTTEYTPDEILAYNGKLYVKHMGKTELSIYQDGKEINTADCRPYESSETGHFALDYSISGGKMYVLNYEIEDPYEYLVVYSCGLDELEKGNPELNQEYNLKDCVEGFVSTYFDPQTGMLAME